MNPRQAFAVALAGLCGALLPAAGALASEGFAAPNSGAVLTAGASSRIDWILGASEGRHIEEMEILLSLDGGKTFPVRITRDLSPGTRSFAWRVSALPTTQARLALRTGEDGEETIVFVSEEFAIAADADAPLEATKHVGGEWRTRDALDGSSGTAAPDPPSMAGAPGSIGSLPALPPATAPKPPLAPIASLDDTASPEKPRLPAAHSIRVPFSRVPTVAPMRE